MIREAESGAAAEDKVEPELAISVLESSPAVLRAWDQDSDLSRWSSKCMGPNVPVVSTVSMLSTLFDRLRAPSFVLGHSVTSSKSKVWSLGLPMNNLGMSPDVHVTGSWLGLKIGDGGVSDPKAWSTEEEGGSRLDSMVVVIQANFIHVTSSYCVKFS